MDQLLSYSWPGNIRELQNIIERGVVLSPGSVLRLDRSLLPDLALHKGFPASTGAEAPVAVAAPPSSIYRPQVPPTLEELERHHILEVLSKASWVIEGPKGAAKVLDLHPNTLRSRMKKLGIKRTSHEMS